MERGTVHLDRDNAVRLLIFILLWPVAVFAQFLDKPVNDNIELAGHSAVIDKQGDVYFAIIDGVIHKAARLDVALDMVYQTKIRSGDDYSFVDQKWGLLIRVSVDDGGWWIDMGQHETYHADTFLKSKEIVYMLFYDMLKGRLLFNYK